MSWHLSKDPCNSTLYRHNIQMKVPPITLNKIIPFEISSYLSSQSQHSTMPVLQPRTFMLWKTKYITEILEMSAIRFSSQFWPQWWWHPELQPDCRQPLFWIEFGGLDCDIIWKSPSFGAVMKNETKHHNNKSQIRHTMILLKSKQRGQKIDKDFAHGEVDFDLPSW